MQFSLLQRILGCCIILIASVHASQFGVCLPDGFRVSPQFEDSAECPGIDNINLQKCVAPPIPMIQVCGQYFDSKALQCGVINDQPSLIIQLCSLPPPSPTMTSTPTLSPTPSPTLAPSFNGIWSIGRCRCSLKESDSPGPPGRPGKGKKIMKCSDEWDKQYETVVQDQSPPSKTVSLVLHPLLDAQSYSDLKVDVYPETDTAIVTKTDGSGSDWQCTLANGEDFGNIHVVDVVCSRDNNVACDMRLNCQEGACLLLHRDIGSLPIPISSSTMVYVSVWCLLSLLLLSFM